MCEIVLCVIECLYVFDFGGVCLGRGSSMCN